MLPVVLRLAMMLGTLCAIQFTYILYSPEIFLTVNMLTFLVGMHTAMTYAVQVNIWETGQINGTKVVQALGTGLTIIVVAGIIGLASIEILFVGLAYILYRFSDRLVFNTLITHGKITQAYGASIVAIFTEIIVFSLLVHSAPESVARLLLPSLLAGSVATSVLCFYVIRLQNKRPDAHAIHGKSDILFALHSSAILFVIMIDRIAPNLNQTLNYLDARYLLLFSYAGAVYSLGVAVIEPLRRRYFSVAKEVDSFATFLAATNARKLVRPIGGIALASTGAFLGMSVINGFADPTILTPPMRDIQIISALLAFFALFLLLMYFQMYFLSRREFGPIFLSWGAAFAVRLIALTLPRLDLYLACSVLAAGTAIIILFVLEYKKN